MWFRRIRGIRYLTSALHLARSILLWGTAWMGEAEMRKWIRTHHSWIIHLKRNNSYKPLKRLYNFRYAGNWPNDYVWVPKNNIDRKQLLGTLILRMRIGKSRLRGIRRTRRYLLRGIGIGFWLSALLSLGVEQHGDTIKGIWIQGRWLDTVGQAQIKGRESEIRGEWARGRERKERRPTRTWQY